MAPVTIPSFTLDEISEKWSALWLNTALNLAERIRNRCHAANVLLPKGWDLDLVTSPDGFLIERDRVVFIEINRDYGNYYLEAPIVVIDGRMSIDEWIDAQMNDLVAERDKRQALEDARRQREAEALERKERAELERLRAKYDN